MSTQLNETISVFEQAKETAIALMQKETSVLDFASLLEEKDLEHIEYGIRQINDLSSRCWLISAVTLYTLIYDQQLYQQSGLRWDAYVKQSKERLGLEARDIAEQLSAARFFIRYHKTLLKKGWSPIGSQRKMARAELATALCGSPTDTINHLVNDTWADFNQWYSSFKNKGIAYSNDERLVPRDDIIIRKNKIYIGGIEPVKVSEMLDTREQARIKGYLEKIFKSLQQGYEPAIISVYDTNEAIALEKLRDANRRKDN